MTKETNDESDIGNMEGQQKPTIKQQKQQQAQKQNEGKNDETVALFAVGTSDPTIPAQVSDIVGSTSSHNKQQDEIPFQFDDPIGTGDTAGQEIYLNGSENDQEVEVRGQADAIPYFQADSIENNFTVTHDKSIQENPSTEAVLESNQNHADSQNGIVDSSGTVKPLNTHSSYSLLSGDSSQSSGIPFSQISYSELENPTTEAEAEVQVATTTETNQAAIGMGSISRMTYEPNVEEPYLEFNEADEESIPFGNENNNPIDEHNMSGGNGIVAAAQPVDEPIPFDGDGDLVLEQPAGESKIPFNTKSDSSSNTAQSVPAAQPVDEPIPFGGDEEMVLEQPVIESKIPFVIEDNGNANTAQIVPVAQPVDEPIPFGGDEEMVLEQPVGETVTFDNVASNTDGVLVENAPISEPIPFDSGDGLVTEQVSTESIPFGGQGNYQEPAVEQNSPINESVPVGQEASDILAEEQPMLESQQPVQFGISHGDSGPSIEGGATVPVKVEEKEEEIPFGENTGGVDEYCNGWEIEELQEVEMEAGTGMEMQVEAETGLGIKQSETSEVEVVQQQQQEQQQQQQQQNDEFNPFGHEASMQQEFWKTSDESIPFVTETQVEGDFFSMLGSQDTQGAGMVQSQTQAQTQPIQQEQYQQEQYQQEQYQQEQYQQQQYQGEQYQGEQYQEEQADQVGYGELAYDEQSGQYYDTVTGDYYDLDYQQYYNAASDSWYYIDELGNKIVTAVAGKAVEMIQPQQQLEPGQFEQQQFEPGQFEQQQQFEQQEQYVQQQFQPGQFEPQQFNQQLFEPLQEQGEFQMQNYYQEEQLNGPENAYSYQMQQEQKIQQEQREGPTQHIQNDQLTFESTGAEYDYNEDYSYGYNYEYEAGESQPLEQNYEEKGLHQDYNYEQLDEYSSTHYTQDTSSVYQPLMEGEIVEGQILEEEILEEEVQAIPQKTGCRPLITFGFGGQVVMYFQTAGQVEITSLGRIVGAEHTAQVEDKPFVFEGSVSRAEDLLGAMTQAGERCQDEMKQTWQPYVKDNRQVAMEKAMWAGLNVLVSSRGFLEKMDKVRLTQLCDELSRIMELNQVGSNENTSDYNNPETVTGGYGTQRQLSQIEQLLVKGEKKQAVDYAIEQKLWAQALIIASCTAREVWKSTVEKYVNSFQQTKSAQHQVLGIQYLMFAGVDDATIFPSPSSTATFGSSNDNVTANIKQRWPRMLRLMLANYATGQSKAIVALGDQLMQCGETAAAHLCYALTLSSSILFRKKSTDKCAGIQTALLAGKGSGNVDSALLVWNRETELALKWTQIYEVAQVVNAASKANANINTNTNTNTNTNPNTNSNTNPNTNPNANANNAGLNTSTLVCLPHFQAYKLSYAIWLADCGHLDLALLHCNCLLNIVESAKKQKSQAAYLHPRYMAALNDWRDRLVNSGVKPLYHDTKKNLSSMPAAASNEKAWLNLSVPRPSLSSILNVVDSGIDKLISGSTSTSNAPSPVYPIPASDHHQPSASSHPTKQTSKDPNAQPVWELGPDKYAIPADYSATKRSLNFNPNPPSEFMAKTRSTPTFIDSKLSSFNNPNLNDPITNNSLMRPPSFDRTSNRGLHSNNSSTSNFSSILQQQQQQQQQQPSLYNPSSANTTPKTSLDYGHGARFEQKHQPPVNDDDDLLLMAGFGNKALKPPKKPASSSLDSDSASKDISTQKQDQQGQRQSQEKDQEQEQEQAQQQTATGGRFGFGLLKNFLWAGTPNNAGSSSANNDPKRKQKKADLGEENSFVFDPVLKRWVNKAAKGAGGQEPSQPTPPPPPPMMPMMQMAPPPPQQQQQQQQQQQHPPPPSLPSLSNTHPSSPHSTPRPSLQGLVNGGTPVTNTSFSSVHSSPSLSSIPAGANTPTMPPGPTMGSAVGGGGRRKNVRSRYVDVFNPS